MHKVITPRLIPVLVAVAFSGGATASGFQLLEQNASGLGNSYAGSAAVAENASTVFYNPAGMTQLKQIEVSGGLTAIKTSFDFTNEGSSVGSLANTGNGNNGGGIGYVPNGFLSWGITKDLFVGLGVGAPFGLRTKYDDQWIGAAQSTHFDVKTININPSIAYRVNDVVSIGGGLNWQRIEADYRRLVSVVGAAGGTTSPLKLTLEDDSWGWNIGALFKVAPSTKVGVSYRSKIKYETTGKIDISGPLRTYSADAKADITLPDTFILSLTHAVSDRLELLGDVSWTGWSSIPKIDIIRASATQNGAAAAGTTAQVLDSDFRDTWRVAVGANYKLNNDFMLRAGVAYDQSPVKGPSTRLVSLPDNNRTWFSLGAQWKASNSMTFDLGGAYLYVKDAKIDNNQITTGATSPLTNRGRVTGNYEDSAWILGGQVSLAF
ncbi:OmpP1/FadL family transporter [Dechloromonas denitrificans]|uniref:OmpP1/FadL family transporter n=1 Tax=Dechloromonas denitrificans TaxID=281362 RepID=UPI001CF874D0|nr:outer membrane protein transport protein [Dechloromonas denitrificans]UCV05332.1 outer membrane protein transport protein [Dechloromonas denitrificans]UCV09676.1 outer membrane protein transport protein [Dechloromonas denitrificans]